MAISELQIALIGAGAVAVGMVWGYNAWQDRKHRKAADRIFQGGQGDALLNGQQAATPVAPSPADDVRREPGERLEPRIAEQESDSQGWSSSTSAVSTVVEEIPPSAAA